MYRPTKSVCQPLGNDRLCTAPNVIMAGLQQVSAGGGSTTPATRLDVSRGDTSHTWPVFLPDGTHIPPLIHTPHQVRSACGI